MRAKIICSNLLATQGDRSLKPKKAMQGKAMQAKTAQTAMQAKTAMQAIRPTSCLAIYTSKHLQNEGKN
jgi:hypothetical protein